MIFNSLPFLIFIVIFTPVFFLLKGRARLWLMVIASYFFYGWWDWRFLGLVAFSTVLDFSLGLWLEREKEDRSRKRILWISLAVNLGVLAFFKYFNFFIDSFNVLLGNFGLESSSGILHIILPVGISFYTFQSLSYTIDVYFRKIPAEPDLLKFAGFIAFFPQLVAGPIVRASDFLPQLKDQHRGPVMSDMISGLDQVCVGFIKKVVIADSLALVVEGAFSAPLDYSSLHLMVSLMFYSFQIYCDFSGYSDIAIGIARMLGYEFPKNFNLPYIATSFSDFWNRWHISLSSWLRDYLYIPLGGNRKGSFNTYKNLMITMLLGGLWHGANWTFVFWGFLHGAYLILQRWIENLAGKLNLRVSGTFAGRVVLGLIVYIFVCYAWIYFRAPNFTVATLYVKGILSFDDLSVNSLIHKFWIVKGVVLIATLYALEWLNGRMNFTQYLDRFPILRVIFYASTIWAVALFGTFSENQFIYFQF
jgi:D-alanyl-lipoteichoic acid acyltransferase DltB (MBOAT superfamily)